MESALAVIGWIMMAATVIPLVPSDAWWVRMFDFPRIQIAISFTATFLAYVYIREDPSLLDNLFLTALSVCVVFQLWRMRPYTPLARKQVPDTQEAAPEQTLSLLVANVLMTNRESERLLGLIRSCNPDVILLLEADSWWRSQCDPLRADYAFTIEQPQDNTYGMLLFSRLRLRQSRVRYLVQSDVPSFHTIVQLNSGLSVELFALHPRPPAPQESKRSTQRDAELLVAAKELENRDVPAIVAGDLNDVAWSRTNDQFQAISRMLDPRIGRGFFCTFNAKWPILRFPLDHVFCSRHFGLLEFKRLGQIGSDHFPVLIKLAFQPHAHPSHAPVASNEDECRAEEKIEEAST